MVLAVVVKTITTPMELRAATMVSPVAAVVAVAQRLLHHKAQDCPAKATMAAFVLTQEWVAAVVLVRSVQTDRAQLVALAALVYPIQSRTLRCCMAPAVAAVDQSRVALAAQQVAAMETPRQARQLEPQIQAAAVAVATVPVVRLAVLVLSLSVFAQRNQSTIRKGK